MTISLMRAAARAGLCALADCGVERMNLLEPSRSQAAMHPGATPEMRRMIAHYAAAYDVPVTLMHRVVQRESGYNPGARNGPHYGLMQILPQTARTMGYRGSPAGLLDAETNLKYGVRYLRGAWVVSGGSPDKALKALMWYSKGYYQEAQAPRVSGGDRAALLAPPASPALAAGVEADLR